MSDPVPADSESPHSPFTLPPLSQLGAVTGRFVHDLANDISSAATLMTLIAEPDNGSVPAKEDLDELNASLERAVTQIHNFGATVRSLRPAPEPTPFAQLKPSFQALFDHYQIPLTVDVSLTDESQILCHPTWLLHCVDYAAHLQPGKETRARLSIVSAASITPPADFYSIDKPSHLFEVRVEYASSEPILPLHKAGPENQPFFVVRELMRHLRGFLLHDTAPNVKPYLALYLSKLMA